MTVQSSLFTTLSTDGDVGPLVANSSSPVTHRIYPDRAPDNVSTPYIVYTVVGERRGVVFNDVEGIAEYIIQLDVWGTSASACAALAAHVVDAVNTGMKLTEVFNPGSQIDPDVDFYRYILQLTVWE